MALWEALSRREQRGWSEARASAGPQSGPETSPNRSEAARREQAKRDNREALKNNTFTMGFTLDWLVLVCYNSKLRRYHLCVKKGACPVPNELTNSAKVVGVKQVRRALNTGRAKRLCLAKDADPQITRPLAEQAREQGVETVWLDSMKELGRDCGIAVGAAAAAAV